MASKQSDLRIRLNFDADVSKAKREMESLQASLDKIMKIQTNQGIGTRYLSEDIEKASMAAASLRVYLDQAFNARTGKLDLVKFNLSLIKSGLTAESLKNTLMSIGPQGQLAFFLLSQAVATSEIPIIRISDRMRKLGVTLANTAKWQFSSTALHAFIGSITSAYNYAQDLNESLNNIRIVTGLSVDLMSRFADKANQAARALSASTLAYTDAALIFYQQGLNDEEVAARAEATVKMSNITGQGAKEVSDQLTAIWNNFAKGSENLEYYADVITALGAATASSSEEISQGLGKFAAVADTVGLSYEKATAALATVIATTRLSADIVGTSFRTIFARLEGLSLGETLDDGVTLNKYSEALAKVGVNILNQLGELKAMDDILDELGQRWNDLNKSLQVGLALTVAGVRQYSQFLALMDNYDYLLQNEQVAESSRGTVQKQADIYAESWEAASKRVRASLEGLYTTLLDDLFFIDINDNFADTINYTKEFINSLGGLKGILTVVGTLLLSTFSTLIADRLSLMGNSIAAVTPRGRARLEAERDRFTNEAIRSYRDGSYEGELQADAAAASILAARTVEKFNKTATEDLKVIAELLRQRAEKAAEEAIKQGEITKELEKLSNQLTRNLLTNLTESSDYDLDSLFNNSYFLEAANKLINATNDFDTEAIRKLAVQDTRTLAYQLGALEEFNENFFREADYEDTSLLLSHNIELIESYEKALSRVKDPLKVLGKTGLETFLQIAEHTKNAKKNFEEYQASLSKLSKELQNLVNTKVEELNNAPTKNAKEQILNRLPSLEGWTQEMTNAVNAHLKYVESANNVNDHLEILEGTINNTRTSMEGARDTATGLGSDGERVAESANNAGHAFGQFASSVHGAQTASKNLNDNLKITGSTLATTSQAITTLGAALMQGTMAVNAVKSIFNVLNNENLSTGEKILLTLTSMTMIIPVLTFVTNKQKIIDLSAAAAKIIHAKANYALATSAKAATTSAWELLIPVIKFVAIAAGIALLIYGIVKAFDALSNSESESEKAVREANEALEAAKENANATKNAYNDLKNEINDYTKTVDALAQYTKGTEEWRNASEQLNESILNLISKYPELLKISNLYNSDGTLNQEVLNDFLELKNVAATAALASEVLAQRKVSTTTLIDRENKYLESIREILLYGLNGVAPELAKAILQLLILTGLTITETLLQTLAYKAISDYENKYNVQFDDRAIDWDKILNSINSLSDSFETLQRESVNLSNALVNSNKSILGIYGDEFSEDPVLRLAQLDAYNQAVANKETELTTTYEKLLKKATDNRPDDDDVDYALGKIGDSKELFEFYQDWLIATGKTINENTKLWKLVGDDALEEDKGFLYYTGEGDNTAFISVAEMAAEMAAYKVGQEIDKILENPNSEFADKLINNPNGAALASFITNGNFNGVTISDIQNLQDQNRQALKDLFGGDEEQLKKVLANLYRVENIDDLTLERFYANFEQGTQGNIIGEALNGYTKYILENLVDSLKDSLKLEDLKPVADMYTKALAESGMSGIEALNEIAERAGSESGPLMSVVAGLDLTAMSAEDVNKQLANAGIAFKLTETDITQLTQLLTDSSHITLKAAQETYQAVSKVLSKLKDEGDIIDADLYLTLMLLNPALKSYFTMMADGTYMLTGAAEDFRTAVLSSLIAQLLEARNNLLNTVTAYGNLDAESGQKAIDNYNRVFYGRNVLVNDAKAELTNAVPNMISALQDSGVDVTKWQAALNDPEGNFLNTAKLVAEKYQEIFSNADIFETKAQEALNKVGLIEEAIAFTRYQNDISNAGLDYEETERYARILQEVNAEGEITLDQARQLAIANLRLDRGLKELNDNYENWSESLKNTGENTLEYASTIGEARDALADLFNISSGDKLSTKWIDKLLKDSERMKKILDGDAEAILDLRKEASGELVDNSNIEDSFRNIQDILEDIQTLNLGTENDNYFELLSDRLENATLSAQGFKDELLRISNAELGTGVSLSQEYTDALNAMLAAGLMTEQELNDIFASIGYKPTVTTGYVELQALIPLYETTEEVTRTSDLIDGDPITGTFRKVTSTRQLEPVPTTLWVPVVQIASNENGGLLNVVNAGALRITPSHGATSAGKKGKSGGSGGGGGSRSKKDLKDADDEIERYHVIDKTIDVLAKKYDRLSASKDAAFGLQRLKYIEQENKLLEKQYKAEKIRLEEVKLYYAKDRGAIEAYGAIIDDNGVITNYEELMRRELGKLNAAYTAYNNGGLSDEIIAAKEKDYEKFKDILSLFEETNSEYLELLKKVDEALRALITGRLEAIKAKVEVDLELPEAELKEIEFKLKTLEDAAFASAEKIVLWGTLAEIAAQKFNTFADAFKEVLTMSVTDEAGNKIGGFGLTADLADRLMNGELGVFDEAGITGENAKALMEALQEYWDNLINEYDAAYLARKNIEDELFNELNEYSDAIEKQISKLQKLVSIANNVKSIIGTMGRSNLGISAEVIDLINLNILAGIKDQVTILKAEQDALETSLTSANTELKDAIARNDQEAILYWTNASQEIESNLLETKEKLLSLIEDYVKKAQEILAESVKENFTELARQTYGMTMDDAIASYDRYKTLSSDYLKDYQKIYELSKLTRAVLNSIDETPSLWIKERLRDLQEEINEYLAEGVQMTRYEVDYLNRKYELRLAELALEEAQNSKDMVRLSRNADGGWGYVYTADQDNIDKAQSDYEEKLYALLQLNYLAIEDSQSTILQLQLEFEEKMIEIMTNNELSEEERNSRIAELQEYYIARMQVYYDTLDSALTHNRELYEQDWKWYNELTGYRISADLDYIDKFEETWVAGLSNGVNSVLEAFEKYKENLGSFDNNSSTLGECYLNLLDYKNQTNEVFKAAGLDVSNFSNTVSSTMHTIAAAINDARTSGKNLATELGTNLPNTIGNISSWQLKINPKLEVMKDTINRIALAVLELIKKLNELSNTNAEINISGTPTGIVSTVPNPSNGNGGTGSGGGGSIIPEGTENDSIWSVRLVNRGNTNSFTYVKRNVSKTVAENAYNNEIKYRLTNGIYYSRVELLLNNSIYKSYIFPANLGGGGAYTPTPMATGGYTGDFGPEGRVAILHEKELVLNKQDTANMLKMVNIAREVLNNANLGLPFVLANRKIDPVFNNGINTLEIHIEASFPNVINHSEIEQAFERLANYSSQNVFNFDLTLKVNFF